MYICIYIYMSFYVHVQRFVCIYIYVYTHMYICIYIYMFACKQYTCIYCISTWVLMGTYQKHRHQIRCNCRSASSASPPAANSKAFKAASARFGTRGPDICIPGNVCMHTCIYTYIGIYTPFCMYVCMYVCRYVCMYVCILICISCLFILFIPTYRDM